MARIRTIKPDFYRHEGLQDLEAANPGRYVMLVFSGLWGHCDREGRFEWRPRQLKLDILPFLNFDMSETLEALERAGFIERYEVDGKQYGLVPTFLDHQRISGKEAVEPAKHPSPAVKRQRKSREAAGKHPGEQEREEEGNKEKEGKGGSAPAAPVAESEVALIAWNQLCERIGLRKVQRFTDARKRALTARLRDCGGIDGWMSVLTKVEASKFLRGDNDRGWKADLDFLVRESSFIKLIEGKYDNATNGPAADHRAEIEARVAAAKAEMEGS